MDFSFKNNLQPQKGSVLLSDPFESDVHFSRSVVLVCTHDHEGSFGFVLNNFVHLPVNELNESLHMFNGRVSIGGPVDKNNLFYIHQFGNDVPDSEHVLGDIYFGGDFDALLKKVVESPENQAKVRFFIGYSGWESEQLNEELKENAWMVVNDCDSSMIMKTDNDELWKFLMGQQGVKYQLLAKSPINPMDN